VRVERRGDGPISGDPELRISVPVWMLDEAACSAVVVCEQPAIELSSLKDLRKLVDQLAKTTSQDNGSSGSMMAKGDRHETRNRNRTQATCPDTASETADA
jgi:hypothetical protein